MPRSYLMLILKKHDKLLVSEESHLTDGRTGPIPILPVGRTKWRIIGKILSYLCTSDNYTRQCHKGHGIYHFLYLYILSLSLHTYSKPVSRKICRQRMTCLKPRVVKFLECRVRYMETTRLLTFCHLDSGICTYIDAMWPKAFSNH